ncbi:MAG: hypothetical protein ACFBSC_10540 [Microcoleaceae cyanobacterium]
MKQQDCSVIFEELVELLDQLNLGWVALHVIDTIRTGKILQETISGRKSPDLKLVDYTPAEKLLLLIDAIDRAVVDTAEIQLEMVDYLNQEINHTPVISSEIHFASPLRSQKTIIQLASEDTAPMDQKQLKSLKTTLKKLQQEVNQIGD